MRFFLLMALYGILSAVLESTWFSNLPFGIVRFDFILSAVAACAFYVEWKRAIPVIIFLGIMSDVASGAPLGVSVFSYMVVYAGIRLLISKISFHGGPALLFWVAVISATDKAVCALVFLATYGDTNLVEVLLRFAPAQVALDAVMGLFLIPFIRWFSDLTWEKIAQPKGLVLK